MRRAVIKMSQALCPRRGFDERIVRGSRATIPPSVVVLLCLQAMFYSLLSYSITSFPLPVCFASNAASEAAIDVATDDAPVVACEAATEAATDATTEAAAKIYSRC